jgi:hypothetical protein
MAAATRKAQPTASPASSERGGAEAASLEVRVYLANGGDYHWEIVDGRGASLVHSGSFASRDLAAGAARRVCEGVPSARFEAPERQTAAV